MPHSSSGSDSIELDDLPFDVNDIDPYQILGLERTSDQKQIKKAYYGAAVKNHPDKVRDANKEAATERFQKIQLAYAILSDEQKKERYDRTGSTKEATELDDQDFDWKDFFNGLNNPVDADAIEEFKSEYQASDKEKADLLAAYTKFRGRMDDVYEHIMVSNVLNDDERFRAIIDKAIEDEDVTAYNAYTQETATTRQKRVKKARAEAKEAEAYAKELNLPDGFFGGKSDYSRDKKGRDKRQEEDSLRALIQQRHQKREQSFFDSLEAKYVAPKAERLKGKKRQVEEPPEEAFQKNAKKTKKGKSSS